MKYNNEILNAASTLKGGAAFTIVYVSVLLLLTLYVDQLYNVGKFEVWPLAMLLVVGEFSKAFIIWSKQECVSKRNKVFKFKNSKVKDCIKSLATLVILLMIYYIVAILFGAPLFIEQEETFMFALVLTIITVLPLLFSLGPDLTITVLTSVTTYERDALSQIMINCLRMTLFGAWLGAVVIPLDWDRPWQVWPIPCSLGALCGYTISQFFILSLSVPEIANLLSKKSGKYGL